MHALLGGLEEVDGGSQGLVEAFDARALHLGALDPFLGFRDVRQPVLKLSQFTVRCVTTTASFAQARFQVLKVSYGGLACPRLRDCFRICVGDQEVGFAAKSARFPFEVSERLLAQQSLEFLPLGCLATVLGEHLAPAIEPFGERRFLLV